MTEEVKIPNNHRLVRSEIDMSSGGRIGYILTFADSTYHSAMMARSDSFVSHSELADISLDIDALASLRRKAIMDAASCVRIKIGHDALNDMLQPEAGLLTSKSR